MSLAIKEHSKSGQSITFRLYATGLPKDRNYSLIQWAVTQKGPTEVISGVTLDASGLAICAGTPGTCGSSDKPDDAIDIPTRSLPGEPVRLALVSSDGAAKAFAKVVPVPLRGEDRSCFIEAVLLTPGAELVLIEGSGFPANREIVMDSESERERNSKKVTADSDGGYAEAIAPYVRGTASGTLKVTLKSSACSPAVKVPWGRRN